MSRGPDRPAAAAMAIAAASLAACGPRMADEGDDESEVCGNGVVEGDEPCDDGNAFEGDGCNTDCRSSGSRQWCVEYGAPVGTNLPTAQVLGHRGGVLVSGYARPPSDPENWQLWILKLDSDGTKIWESTIAVDGDEKRYLGTMVRLGGKEQATLVGYLMPENGPVEAWLGTLSGDGELVDEVRFSDPGGLAAYAAVADSEELWVAGGAGGMGWLARLDAQFEIVWEDRFELEQSTVVRGLARFEDGRVALVGRTTLDTVGPDGLAPTQGFIRIYDADQHMAGQALVPADIGESSWELTAAQVLDGELLVSGRQFSGPASFAYLRRFGADAQLLAEVRPFEHDLSEIRGLAVVDELGLFAAGYRTETFPRRYAVWRFADIEAPPVWAYEGPEGSFDDLDVADSGPAVYVVGTDPTSESETTNICKFSQ